MTTPSPSPPISLSPPSTGERIARCTAPPTHSSPPHVPSLLLPSFRCPTQVQTLRIASTQALIDAMCLRYVGPFRVLAKVRKVAYRLELPQELSRVHHTFHVSNLKKCYVDEPLVMPLEGIHVDDKLQLVEELVEIMKWEIKRLKRSRIPLVKVHWNSWRGLEFTWEREDSFKQKYPQLFTNRASSSTTRS
ncbi:putative reverse transcriptase domain-containing protein [Tanacetum coccineum]